jgi:hypothetical protein
LYEPNYFYVECDHLSGVITERSKQSNETQQSKMEHDYYTAVVVTRLFKFVVHSLTCNHYSYKKLMMFMNQCCIIVGLVLLLTNCLDLDTMSILVERLYMVL